MIKIQYPYVDDNGNAHNTLVKTYTDKEGYVLLQKETNIIYGNVVIDLYPCQFTYEEVKEEETQSE